MGNSVVKKGNTCQTKTRGKEMAGILENGHSLFRRSAVICGVGVRATAGV